MDLDLSLDPSQSQGTPVLLESPQGAAGASAGASAGKVPGAGGPSGGPGGAVMRACSEEEGGVMVLEYLVDTMAQVSCMRSATYQVHANAEHRAIPMATIHPAHTLPLGTCLPTGLCAGCEPVPSFPLLTICCLLSALPSHAFRSSTSQGSDAPAPAPADLSLLSCCCSASAFYHVPYRTWMFGWCMHISWTLDPQH